MLSSILHNFLSFLCLVGLIFLAIAYRSWNSTTKIIKNGIHTEGVVISLESRKTKQGQSTTKAPAVQFKTEKGEVITYYSTTYTSSNDYYIGQVVPIWYMPDNPQEATLKGANMYLLPLVFTGFGILAMLFGLPSFFRLLISLMYQR